MKMLEGLGVPRVLPGPAFSANFTPFGPACGPGSPTRRPTPDVGTGPSGSATLTSAPVPEPAGIPATAVVTREDAASRKSVHTRPHPAAESLPTAVTAGLPLTVIDANRDFGTKFDIPPAERKLLNRIDSLNRGGTL